MAILNRYRDGSIFYHHTVNLPDEPPRFEAHFHDTYEILCVTSGEGAFFSEGVWHRVVPGRIFIMRPGETHLMQIDEGVRYERTVVNLSPKLLSHLGHEAEERLLSAFCERPSGASNEFDICELGESARLFATIPDTLGGEMLGAVVKARVISLLCDIWLSGREAEEPVAEEDSPLQKALVYIKEHLGERMTLSDIAGAAFISVQQLCRLFRSSIGTTVQGYITKKRLIAARGMMESGSDASDAASACGFGSYSSFYRAYIAEYGRPPKHKRSKKGE